MSSIGLEIHGTRPITISVATFRKLSGLGNTKVYELIKNGTLETVLVGRKRLITFRSVERLLLPETASEAPRVSKVSLAALAARKHWLTVEWLPKYAPELNDIEVVWRDLKAHHLAHQTFTDAEALDREIHTAVEALNSERNVDSLVNWRISA